MIRQVSISQQLVEEIQRYIIDNDLRPGDKLPSEKELMEKYGVGRSSIREALKCLEILGVIECRPGNGTIIKPFNFSPLSFQMMMHLYQDENRIEKLKHLRSLLELGVVDDVLDRACDEDIARLEGFVAKMREAVDGEKREEFIHLDQEFHQTYVSLCGNDLINQLNISFDEIFRQVVRIGNAYTKRSMEAAIESHVQLVEIFKMRNKENFAKALRKHILNK